MIYKFDNNQTNIVPNPTVPLVFKVQGKPWIAYGVDNVYPSYISELFAKSAICKRALLSKITGVFGSGLKTQDPNLEYVLGRANDEESWNDVFEKIVTDYEVFGGFAVNVVWNRDGEKINSFYHMPFESIRSTEIDPLTDRVETYLYSSNWPKYKKHRPIAYQAFDPAKAIEAPSQILYYFDYSPGQVYYPIPSYSGSLQDIQIDIEVSNFHLSNLANGVNPSLFVSFHNGIPDPTHQQQVYNNLASTFSGTMNTGKFFMSFSDDKEHAPEITPIESSNDDYMLQVEERITSRILTGMGITSPLLLGLYHSGSSGLGSNKNEIMVAYEHFKNTVLRPDIAALLKPMDKLFKYFGYNSKLYIEPLKLFEAGEDTPDNTAETAVV